METELTQKGRDFAPTDSQKLAQEIMGPHFFGIEQAAKHLGVVMSNMRVRSLASVPFPRTLLEKCKHSHILVAALPISIAEIFKRVSPALFRESTRRWLRTLLDHQVGFTQEQGETSWLLVRRTSAEGSCRNSWERQQSFVGEGEKVPSARVMVYTIIGHHLATGGRIFTHESVRTSSGGNGNHVNVGFFRDDKDGLLVDCIPDGYIDSWFGIAACYPSQHLGE